MRTHPCLYVSFAGLVPVFFAAGRALGVNEGNLAGEAGKASEEEGTSAISKAGTSARFVLCLGLLMKSM